MSARVLPVMALAGLAACNNAPVIDGALRSCDRVAASEYDLRPAEASHLEGRIDARGWSSTEGGQTGRSCVPETGGATIGLNDRRCVQSNDLFVRLDDGAGAHYYHVPAGQTFAVYARDGAAVCEVAEAS